MSGIKVSVNFNSSKVIGKLKQLLNDEGTMIAAHNLLLQKMTPYVPFDTGTLSQDVDITKDYVRYKQPYAHYMYEGIVYGPSIPIIKDGVVVGFYSRPGVKKTPTGEYINYDKSHHPLATSHWDKAMMESEGDAFIKQLEKLFIARLKKL